MVHISKTYRCDKCRKPHRTFNDAEACELQHIVTETTESFRRDIDALMNRTAPAT